MTNKEAIAVLLSQKEYYNDKNEDSYVGFDDDDNEALDIAIKALEQEWIPCSERLPDYGVSVLTWDGYCYCAEKRIPFIRDEDGEPISSDWWVSDEYDECDSDYYPDLRDGACIAWMSLPEPYVPDTNVGEMSESEEEE